MAVVTKYLKIKTKGNADIINVTEDVAGILSSLSIDSGIVTISVIGSTGALTTCEFEPGLVQDLQDLFDRYIPEGHYHHDETWHDGNGHSHLRASLVGPSLTLPFNSKKVLLGTWQQIIFLDFDNRSRDREIVFQFIGE